MKAHFKSLIFAPAILAAVAIVASAGFSAQKPITDDVFKTGKIRFVPLLTITDDAMGGRSFFSRPSDVAEDEQGRIYISDFKESHIKVFDAAGTFLRTIGRAGQGPGDFRSLVEVEFADGSLYAIERIIVSLFTPEGRFLRSLRPENGRSIRAMRALRDGRFVAEKRTPDYQSPDHRVAFSLELLSPEMAPVRTICRRELHPYIPISEPTPMDLSKPFEPDLSWTVLPSGNIAVSDGLNDAIELHDPDKGLISTFSRAFEPLPVTAEDQKEYLAGVSYMTQEGGVPKLHKGAADYMIKATIFPKFHPPFKHIWSDAQGRIWVLRPSHMKDTKTSLMDVFDAGGRFIGRVTTDAGPLPYRLLPWSGGFWMIRQTEEDEYAVIKYAVEAVK